MSFYTNIFQIKNDIYHYYIDDNGKRQQKKIRYKPHLGIRAKRDTGYKDIFGKDVGLLEFDNIFEMYSWRKENEHRFDIYDDIGPTYQFISDTYPDEITGDFRQVTVFNIDIEVYSNQGFPYPNVANHPVTAITIHDMFRDTYYVFGCNRYTPKAPNVHYKQCLDEIDLLEKFIQFISRRCPDILTGWNIDGFDVPYLINRSKKILEKGRWLDMSPVGKISYSEHLEEYKISGVQVLDYIKLYKKFRLEPRESYALNTISQIELGDEKVDYHEEYASLSDLYDNNYELFIDYNIKDTELIGSLNNKLHYIELIMTMAFMGKVNFEDAFGSVKIWDVFVYNELRKNNVVTSPKKKSIKEEFPGGYVKEPTPGMHEWLLVADITSSYPNQIISFNLSPETIIDESDLPNELYDLKYNMEQIDSYVDLEDIKKNKHLLKKHNVSMTANGEFFSKEKYGIFPQMIAQVFNQRKELKKKSSVLKNELDELKNQLRKLEVDGK